MYRWLAIVLLIMLLAVGINTGEWLDGLRNCVIAFIAFAVVIKFFEFISKPR